MMGRRRFGILAIGAMVTMVAACSSTSPGPVYSSASNPSGKKLTIGIDFTEPGIGYKSGDTYTGFDVDTARYVADQLGVPEQGITWKEVDPADREKLLQTGQVDMVFATYSITPAREKLVSFAGPYFVAHQGLLVRRDDDTITGPDTLDGKTLCTARGSTSAQRVQDLYRGSIKLVQYPLNADCVEALYDGKVDAVTTDDLILAGFASESKYKGVLRVLDKTFSDETYGVGIKKGDSSLVAQVNTALTKYIADGSWKASLDRNVAPSGYAIPSPPTPGKL